MNQFQLITTPIEPNMMVIGKLRQPPRQSQLIFTQPLRLLMACPKHLLSQQQLQL
jgi:hypothetical protein